MSNKISKEQRSANKVEILSRRCASARLRTDWAIGSAFTAVICPVNRTSPSPACEK